MRYLSKLKARLNNLPNGLYYLIAFVLIIAVIGIMENTSIIFAQDTGPCRSNPVAPPPRFRWEANCDLFCTHNDGCPKTDFGEYVVKPEDTGWCYGFATGSRCLKLEWVGPKGGTHSDGCSVIRGWACDPDDYNRAVTVSFYEGRDKIADGQPAAGGRKIGETTANLQADPGVAAECGGNPNHGYRWTIPASLRDGRIHEIYAYAYRQAGDEPKLWNFENTRTGEKDNNNPVLVQCTGSTCPVNPPTGLTPTGSTCTDSNQKVVLSWNRVQGADSYDLRADGNNISLVGIANNCQAHAVCVNNLQTSSICDTTTCRVTAGVALGQEYRWWVNARGTGCIETEPTNASFTVSGVCGEITPTPQTCLQTQGDLNGDGRVDELDFNDWRTVFLGGSSKTICNGKTQTDLIDFNIWRYYRYYIR